MNHRDTEGTENAQRKPIEIIAVSENAGFDTNAAST
jgi:hypothetical protein